MQTYINALLLRFDGDSDGKNAPTKGQVAVTWGAAALIASRLLR